VAVASGVFLFILIAAHQATTYYAGTGANEGTFATTKQATYNGATSTTHGSTFSLAAPTFRLVLSLGY